MTSFAGRPKGSALRHMYRAKEISATTARVNNSSGISITVATREKFFSVMTVLCWEGSSIVIESSQPERKPRAMSSWVGATRDIAWHRPTTPESFYFIFRIVESWWRATEREKFWCIQEVINRSSFSCTIRIIHTTTAKWQRVRDTWGGDWIDWANIESSRWLNQSWN